MEQKDYEEVRAIMKKVFILCFILYGLFSALIFIVFKNVLSDIAKFLVITFAPLLTGLVILGIYKRRHVKPDETDESKSPENENTESPDSAE